MKERKNSTIAGWKVHASNLLNEIVSNPQCSTLRIPINILGKLLYLVGKRAAEINDKELNRLMMRLTIYEIADPEKDCYDREFVNKYLGETR